MDISIDDRLEYNKYITHNIRIYNIYIIVYLLYSNMNI